MIADAITYRLSLDNSKAERTYQAPGETPGVLSSSSYSEGKERCKISVSVSVGGDNPKIGQTKIHPVAAP